MENQETTEDQALRAHLVSQAFTARKAFEETVDQGEDRVLQDLRALKAYRVMTHKATKDLRENQVIREIQVRLVTRTTLLGRQPFNKSPVTEDRRVIRATLEA